jgi:hypothetical protein
MIFANSELLLAILFLLSSPFACGEERKLATDERKERSAEGEVRRENCQGYAD